MIYTTPAGMWAEVVENREVKVLAVIEGGAMKKLQVDGLDILVDDTFEIPNGIAK